MVNFTLDLGFCKKLVEVNVWKLKIKQKKIRKMTSLSNGLLGLRSYGK